MSNEDWRERAERIERTIAFIIEQHAQAEVRAAESDERWKQADERWKQADERWEKNDERWARTAEGIGSLLAIAEIHEREIMELRDVGRATDERLSILINVVERQIGEGRNGKKEK
ncbi:MAG TPA: hypothetical protein VLB68_12325 [Pyrinomonadaceae bacterium]|nr:hypothetical protein [Pyrinomonadaceae bacterium]